MEDTVPSNIRVDIITLEDGYKYFWTSKGAMSASQMRVIADILDKENEPYDRQVKEYFEKQKVGER